MPRATSTRQLLEAIEKEYTKLEEQLSSLTDEQRKTLGDATHWAPKDIVAHLHEWATMVLSWYEAGKKGEMPQLPAPGYKWNQIPALNEQIYQQYKDHSWAQLFALFEQSRDKIWEVIRTTPNDEMFTPGHYAWTGKNTMGTYFVSATSSHYVWATKEIRKWVKQQS